MTLLPPLTGPGRLGCPDAPWPQMPSGPVATASKIPRPFLSYACVNVCPALVVWLCQHADHGQQDLFHGLHRTPPLRAALVHGRIVPGRVENGDADASIRVDVGVEEGRGEAHGGRRQWIVPGEGEDGWEEAVLVRRALW